MVNTYNLGLTELEDNDQRKVIGGIKIGSFSITTSIITKESELTEKKLFSIHWDDSGISIKPL